MFRNLLPTLKYALLTLKHKWFVFIAGLKIKVPLWRLITHDMSKLWWKELPHYGRQFFGTKDDPIGFISCWLHHQGCNDHHWEYWIPRTGHNRCNPPFPDGCPVPMPEAAVREMLADWMGASRAYEGRWPDPHHWEWFEKHFAKMDLHPDTRILILDTIRSIWHFIPLDMVNPDIPIQHSINKAAFNEIPVIGSCFKCGLTVTFADISLAYNMPGCTNGAIYFCKKCEPGNDPKRIIETIKGFMEPPKK